MAYEQKDMSGSVFANDKGDNDKRPDMKGSAKINGVEYWVSAWKRNGDKGEWLSLSFTKKEAKRRDNAPTPPQATGDDFAF